MSEQPSVDVGRRRKADKPTEHAEAPIRRQTGGGGGFNIPSKGKMGGCGGILILLLIIGIYLLSGGGGDNQEASVPLLEPPTESNPITQNLPTNTPRPTRVPVSGQTGQKWLVMLYQDADDQVLEQDIFVDLNEAERAGSTAQLLFMDGKLTQVYGYQGQNDTGAPAEITPAEGDTFIILQKWMDLDSSGNVTQVVEVPGDTLTFGNNSIFTWSAVYAPAGEYLVGFMVADLDGNTSQSFTRVTMQ